MQHADIPFNANEQLRANEKTKPLDVSLMLFQIYPEFPTSGFKRSDHVNAL